jgi:hypothetical protein
LERRILKSHNPYYNVTGQIVCHEDILLYGKGEGGVTENCKTRSSMVIQ